MIDDQVEYPINGTLDLHVFHPKDVADVVLSYIEACLEKGILHIRIVHGKGKGVQRERVAKILQEHPNVLRFKTAAEDGGGWGATLADLVGD